MAPSNHDRTARHLRITARVAVILCGGSLLAACGSAEPVANGPAPVSPSSAMSSPGTGEGGVGRAQAVGPMIGPKQSVLDSVEQTEQGSFKSGGTLRVVSARGNLSGQRELKWVAGGVEPYRNASCTQRFRLGNEEKPARKANLLLCWRTGAEKSVIAVLVDPNGKPSKAKAVRALDKKWRSMG